MQPGGEGKGSVLVVNSQNMLEKRDVTLGLQTATEVEILSGLQENETVMFGDARLNSGRANSSRRSSWSHPPAVE